MKHIGFYSGSFDPVTFGHTDVIRRACHAMDELVIGIGINPTKSPLFTIEERVAMLQDEVGPISEKEDMRITVVTFTGLVVRAARRHNATTIIRGVRDSTDFDYEMQMAGMNGEMAPEIETVFIPSSPKVRHIAANLVRAVTVMGGDASPFVSANVLACLESKAGGRSSS